MQIRGYGAERFVGQDPLERLLLDT